AGSTMRRRSSPGGRARSSHPPASTTGRAQRKSGCMLGTENPGRTVEPWSSTRGEATELATARRSPFTGRAAHRWPGKGWVSPASHTSAKRGRVGSSAWSSLDAAGEPLDDVFLQEEEHDEDRGDRDGHSREDQRPLARVFAAEGEDGHGQGLLGAPADVEQGGEEVVPDGDPGEHDDGPGDRPQQREHDVPERRQGAGAVDAGRLLVVRG